MASNLAAVIPEAKAQLKIETRPVPKPGPGQLVVRNYAVAANPVDWKIQDYNFFVETYPNVLGSDVSGVVEAVGPDVTIFKKGDRVTGFALSIASGEIDEGAFQTYTLLREQATAKIPQGISFEEATTFPMGIATAISGFYETGHELPRGDGSRKPYEGQGLVVWSASTSVGVMVIQLAKDLGYTVFGTASPAQHAYLKSLGVTALADYKDPDAVSKIVDAAKQAGVPITFGYDAIGTDESPLKTAQIVSQASQGKKGKVAYVLALPEVEYPPNVEFGHPTAFKIFVDDQKEVGRSIFNDYLPQALERGAIKPAPKVQIVEGGIKNTQKLWDTLKAGVSGTKLVIKVE